METGRAARRTTDDPSRSVEDIGAFLRGLKGAFADARHEIGLIGPSGGYEVAACWTFRARHTGAPSRAPPGGAEAAFDGVDLHTMRHAETSRSATSWTTPR